MRAVTLKFVELFRLIRRLVVEHRWRSSSYSKSLGCRPNSSPDPLRGPPSPRGRDFGQKPVIFFATSTIDSHLRGRRKPEQVDKHKKEMTPDRCVLDQGSFLFCLGFNHWVTSLSAGSTGLFLFGWNPFRSIHVLQRSIAIGIYVKRKKWKAQPAGVLTISGITFFRTISLPYFCFPCNTGFRTKNFRVNGGKGRIQNICPEDN